MTGAPLRGEFVAGKYSSVKSRNHIIEALRQALPELRRDFGVRQLALFGSYARGDATEESDVDLVVEFAPSLGLRFVDLADRIEAIVGVRAEVISRRAISARHWSEIAPDLIHVV